MSSRDAEHAAAANWMPSRQAVVPIADASASWLARANCDAHAAPRTSTSTASTLTALQAAPVQGALTQSALAPCFSSEVMTGGETFSACEHGR